ncbi:hypothetical protein PV328_001511 [Microctonus aethiopoides]|uniref:HTH CENPB-type domain-containing protein n=1 Tax=Microctonus aethiopoides TaxID=144406 RepID=A0AA39KXK3_9HYME|nr:hypothetical protein PV328_001511 [Microctonus aethiopoides]
MAKNDKKSCPKKNFTIRERAKILERLENGERQVDLAKEFMVNKSTIATIYRRRENILKSKEALESCDGDSRKKRFRGTESSPLEIELIKWYQQQRDVGLRVTGINLKEKALQLNEKYEAHQRFQASSGWLDSFKKRWGVKCLSIQKEKKPTDYNISERFKKELVNLINLNNTNLDFIYNCDETGLDWKMLPNKNLSSNNEQFGGGLKKIKDRVTILACTNASGSHKIPLFVIGKYKEPKCFKKLTHLSIHYEYSTNQWMDRTLMLH